MSIKLSFLGAARTVTGSCFLLETEQARMLIDCGMFQGSKTLKELNYGPFSFEPRALDALLLTHAHIDHCGLIPKLAKAGYAGPIFATQPTGDLAAIMLPDSGHIQEMEVEFLNRRNQRRGISAVSPIYTVADAERCLSQFRAVDYDEWFSPAAGIRARYWNAGHLLGSASIEIEVERPGTPLRLLFSGDIGSSHKALEARPRGPASLDYVICESTYGDTDRKDRTAPARLAALGREVDAAARAGGPLVIPSFAVERTQELLADLITLMDEGTVPRAPVFIDSPLAIAACDVFRKHTGGIKNGAALRRALDSDLVHYAQSVEESRAIAKVRGFAIIMAASGMCEAGRIRFHLRDNLWRANATVLIVGYQAPGTLGRLLLDGEERVRIQGEDVRVKARIRCLDDYSGHADAPELVDWIAERVPIRRGLILVHGDEDAQQALVKRIPADLVARERILLPALDSIIELGGDMPQETEQPRPHRIEAPASMRRDWHNDLSRLILDIDDRVKQAGDEKARGVIIRRLRRALEKE